MRTPNALRFACAVLIGLDAYASPERPYEFAWAGRTQDEFPPVARLESASGWRVVASNGEARIRTVEDRALFGDGVVRLDYRAFGRERVAVRLEPRRPIAVPDGFDTASLWVYGNNINGKFGKDAVRPTDVGLEFSDVDGRGFRLSLGDVHHREWFLLTGCVTNGLGGRATAPCGHALTAVTFLGGTNLEWRTLDVTSLCVFRDPHRPIACKPRPRRGVRIFRDQPQGFNVGEGVLPFPNHPETVIPPSVVLSRKLEFRFPRDKADWSDLAFRYGGSDWIPLAVGGGLEPRVSAADAEVAFRRVGNSLVCEIARPEPGIEKVLLGKVHFPGSVKTYAWPYYGWGWYHPKTAVAEVDGAPLFVSATIDWTMSNASQIIGGRQMESGPGTELNSGTVYLPRTDGLRNGCFERIVWTFGERVEDTFPVIPNPPSEYRKVLGSSVWAAWYANDRQKDAEHWRKIRAKGISRLIVADHEVGWRDGQESNTFRTRTAPKKGGDKGQYDFARVMIDELGYRYGPYNNFTDFCPVNGFWSIDRASRNSDGSLQHAWYRNYAPKPTWSVGMCEWLAPEIRRKFSFNTAYCDVHTCVTPWSRTDYDDRSPGAGTFAQTYYAFGEIMLLQKAAWKGPVTSEGGVHFLYAGLTDGDYAQDPGYGLSKNAWLVDFDLRRIHPLECPIGMGAPYMYYGDRGDELRKADPDGWLDGFIAATLAFGHAGFLVFGYEAKSYFPVQAIAARYTQAEVAEIRYGDAGNRLFDTSAALANGAVGLRRIRVCYSDGTVVAVNGADDGEPFRVEIGGIEREIPPRGWYAQTADQSVVTYHLIENGRHVRYARSPDYEYPRANGD